LRHLPAALREIPAAAWSCETVRAPAAHAARACASTVAVLVGVRTPYLVPDLEHPFARLDAAARRRGRAAGSASRMACA
jgi:hypothetical protein